MQSISETAAPAGSNTGSGPWPLLRAAGAFRLGRRVHRDAIAILTYHRVRPAGAWLTGDRHPNVLSTVEFASQIAYLASAYRVISGEEFRRIQAGEMTPPRHAAMITFDDGYRDNYAEALPVLERFRVPATFFVSTGFVGDRRNRLWLDRLDAMLARIGPERLHGWLHEASVPWSVPTAAALRTWAKRASCQARTSMLGELERAFGALDPSDIDGEPMTWSELAEMVAAGMTIGSHTVTHQIVSAASEQELIDEVTVSRSTIEARLGVPCWSFSYPNGETTDFSAREVAALSAAGYECAFTQCTGFVDASAFPLTLPRIPVPATPSLDVFRSRLTGVHAWLSGLREVWQ
jgi:peptidoglycan/xylan/chitin deacetylase (PgdA/CDA1 family)